MTNLDMSRLTLFIFRILLLVVLPVALAWAGDEEMMNPYTKFDPETGYFIPIEQPTEHKNQESTDVASSTPDSKAQTPAPAEVVEAQTFNPSLILTLSIIGIAVILFGVGFSRHRKSRESTR